jgi:aryl-alcohol dehydrogenase-like predicted oxidoreductase
MSGARGERAVTLAPRRLGAGPLEVSAIALGSWRTYERMPREDAGALMAHALGLGINFLDEARYDDETGQAPLASGQSEVLFGELLRGTRTPREDVVVSEKLWWQFWPAQNAAAELAESLGRLRFEAVDLIYCVTLPDGLEVARAVDEVAGLIASGAARAWGVANWSAADLLAAADASATAGIDGPCAAQLPYSLVDRGWAEDPAMLEALRANGAGLVASAVLAGGALSARYRSAGAPGRLAARLEEPSVVAAAAAGAELSALAAELGDTTAAALAVAFTLDHPALASVLVGASAPAQLDATVGALELHARLSPEQRERLRAIGTTT